MLRFIEKAEQLKIFDAADEASAVVRSPGFADHLPKFEAVRFDLVGWATELKATARRARSLYVDRGAADDRFENESREVRDLVADFGVWLGKLHAAARAIEASDHPLAPSVVALFKVGDFDADSAENVYGDGPLLLGNVVRLGDLSEVGLPPAFVAEAQALLDRFDPDREDAWGERTMRQTRTAQLHLAIERIVDLMERYARYREFAMAMSGEEIPELGLAVIRSALAPRPAPAPTLGAAPALTP